MTEHLALVALNAIPGIGAAAVRQLQASLGSAAAIFTLPPAERAALSGLSPRQLAALEAGLPAADPEREIQRAHRAHITILDWTQPQYPPQLLEIDSPPIVLYILGNPAALSQPGAALIGTRQASVYGRETARRLACQLAAAGINIISGLAQGIDTEAHEGALLCPGGLTTAIIGSALDCLYPAENRPLARRMIDSGGAVISEYPFGRPADRQTFPMRNRIVSGLSRGVVVIETALKGGTLITAEKALEQNRPVMAIPGRIDMPSFQGNHRLIQDGATLVATADDILHALSHPPSTLFSLPAPQRPRPPLTENEQRLTRHLPPEGALVDTLITQTGFTPAQINSLLIGLEIRRLIRRLPGGRIAPARDF